MAGTTTGRRYGVNAGLAIKVPCQAASIGNVTLSGEQTIDGVALVENDRVLLKAQTDTTENGIWNVSTGSWRRSPDFDGIADVTEGTLVQINDGTTNEKTMWRVTTAGEIIPGTTSIAFEFAAIGGIGTTTDLVAHSSGLASQTVETVQSRFNRVMYITDFAGVDPTGVTDSTAGITAARDYIAGLSNPVKLIWPVGIYSYSVSPNWAIQGFMMESMGDVRLRYTGVGDAFILDGGAAGGGVFDTRVGRFYIEAPSTAGNGVYMRAVHHGVYDFNVRGCGTASASIKTEWCVLNNIRLQCSVNQGAFFGGGKPKYGIHSADRGGVSSAYNVYDTPIIEGVDIGIYLDNCIGEQIVRGASEGNTTMGLKIGATGNLNVIDGTDFESNAGGLPSGLDIEIAGGQNLFKNIASDSMYKVLNGARFNRADNCAFFNIQVDAGAVLTGFTQCVYDRQGVTVGTYVDNGTKTVTRDLISTRLVSIEGALGRAVYDQELVTVTEVVGASPWTYTNTTTGNLSVLVTGGQIGEILFIRPDVGGNTTRYEESGGSDALGSSMFELAPGDGIRITYDLGFSPAVYTFTR